MTLARGARAGILIVISTLFATPALPQNSEAARSAPAKGVIHDLIIRNGTIYDGSGAPPLQGDLAIDGDVIAAVGDLKDATAEREIEARGLAVAPGFINMLSWATETLIADGRSQSDIRQGVTLEVFGEGISMGPLDDAMKKDLVEHQGDIKYAVEWTTLGEYLDFLAGRGVSTNVASFLGTDNPRLVVLGHECRDPTSAELDRMREVVRTAMEEGALGIGSSLIYEPGFCEKTAELVELAKVAAAYGGIYISHLRSEGNRLIEAVDELLSIARQAKLPAEIYHLKASGKANWGKMDEVIRRVEKARAEGLAVTADMYTYPAAATGLDAAMPPWVQEGGHEAWVARLRDPKVRERVKREMSTPSDDWENTFLAAGGPENILLVGFKQDSLKPLTGKTLAEVAARRGTSPEETAMDLVVQDNSRIETIYFTMDEKNLAKEIALPWVSFGSDEGSYEPAGVFLKSNPHPRAYGTFARLLGKYVRDEKVIPLPEAIRRLTSLPAGNLKLDRRGALRRGFFADVVVFDPEKIQDHATFADPHRYATGVLDVIVNGVPVLENGEHTGATPGRVVRGPGWKGAPAQTRSSAQAASR
jgi:N-acyl-D-amino-acid deacylase